MKKQDQHVLFERLAWKTIAERLRHDCRVVIPLGATEEHGDLSVASDTLTAEHVGAEACRRAGVLMAPALSFGASAFAINYPGTISLRTTTLCAVVEDIVDCLYRQGFRRLIFLTGHGGNEVVTGVLSELQLDRPGLVIYYRSATADMTDLVRRIEGERGLPKGEHAAWFEAFDFNRCGNCEEAIHTFPQSSDFPDFPVNPRTAPSRLGNGIFNGASVIPDDALMNRLFTSCVAGLSAFLLTVPCAVPEE